MTIDGAYRLLRRARLKGYDAQARTFKPWHRLVRYQVKFGVGKRVAHLMAGNIVLSDPTTHCPHVVVHDFVHEVGHAQLLFLDVAVLAFAVSMLSGALWYWYVVGFLVWQFGWRELVADLYAVATLGPRNTWLGYAHLSRGERRRGDRAPSSER